MRGKDGKILANVRVFYWQGIDERKDNSEAKSRSWRIGCPIGKKCENGSSARANNTRIEEWKYTPEWKGQLHYFLYLYIQQ